jgi:hypothetical protein
MMKTKRNFLLLEVLMAIALVAVFAAPLMRWPIKHYRAQITRLENFECQRLADWTFSEIKELLLKEGIVWDKLPAKGQELNQGLSDAKLLIPHLPPRTVHRSFTLFCKGEKQGIHGEIFRIYRVEIVIDSKKIFHYRILVQQTCCVNRPQKPTCGGKKIALVVSSHFV